MKPIEDPAFQTRSSSANGSVAGTDEAQVIQAMEAYAAALQAGQKPDREEFLARHPAITEALAECLAGLEFVHAAAPDLSQPPGERGGRRADGAAGRLSYPP